jgi:hypothetical protein
MAIAQPSNGRRSQSKILDSNSRKQLHPRAQKAEMRLQIAFSRLLPETSLYI